VGEVFFEGILVDIPSSKVDLRLVYAFGGKYGLGFQKDEIVSEGGFPPVSH
jgi:hypothetical protein